MQEPEQTDIVGRLRLIEEMMAEGRRITQRWGWVFLLWGVGPLIAMWWEANLAYRELAWPLVLTICVIINGVVIKMRRRAGDARTTAKRSMGAVWASTGVTALLVALGAALNGAVDFRWLCIVLFSLAAVGHSASSIILRWPPQFLAAIVWWAAGLIALIRPSTDLHTLSAAAILFGNVILGAWLTWRERSRRDE